MPMPNLRYREFVLLQVELDLHSKALCWGSGRKLCSP